VEESYARTGRADLVHAARSIPQRLRDIVPMGVSNPSLRWSYEEDGRVGADGYTIVSPYGSEEGIAYGEGTMEPPSAGLRGTVVWSNYPRRRTDGGMLPNVRGLITTQDGASVVFDFRGRTIFEGRCAGTAEPCRLVRVRSRKLPLVERLSLHRRGEESRRQGRIW
jgi:hypothetical protein